MLSYYLNSCRYIRDQVETWTYRQFFPWLTKKKNYTIYLISFSTLLVQFLARIFI